MNKLSIKVFSSSYVCAVVSMSTIIEYVQYALVIISLLLTIIGVIGTIYNKIKNKNLKQSDIDNAIAILNKTKDDISNYGKGTEQDTTNRHRK